MLLSIAVVICVIIDCAAEASGASESSDADAIVPKLPGTAGAAGRRNTVCNMDSCVNSGDSSVTSTA
jgi:hypothetical protein